MDWIRNNIAVLGIVATLIGAVFVADYRLKQVEQKQAEMSKEAANTELLLYRIRMLEIRLEKLDGIKPQRARN